MEQHNVEQYIAQKLASGESPDGIIRHLVLVGWAESDAKILLAKGLIASGVPTPASHIHLSGGKLASTVEVVLNFFSFILLGIVATAFGILYYQIINAFFPDPLRVLYGSYDASRSAMHYAMAALLIGFPLYAFSVRVWFKRFLSEDEKVESKLSKWLTYLVLLIAAVTIVGDLITSIFFLLQGEITIRFFLKALTILGIAGIVFGFYFFERKVIQYRESISRTLFVRFFSGVSLLVFIGIVLGFVVGGSPSTERLRGLDSQRANDLMNIANCVSNYGVTYKRLPETLSELSKSTGYMYCGSTLADPETGLPYEYRVVTSTHQNGKILEGEFELCATFALSSQGDIKGGSLPATPYENIQTKWSEHAAGRSCDVESVVLDNTLTISPENGTVAIPVK